MACFPSYGLQGLTSENYQAEVPLNLSPWVGRLKDPGKAVWPSDRVQEKDQKRHLVVTSQLAASLTLPQEERSSVPASRSFLCKSFPQLIKPERAINHYVHTDLTSAIGNGREYATPAVQSPEAFPPAY